MNDSVRYPSRPGLSPPVFISYSSSDKTLAETICIRLEQSNIDCWMAPRNITPGLNYGQAIIGAINECRIMVVVFTDHANRSKFVSREVERAVSKGRIIIPVRLEDVLPWGSLEFFLCADHWLDATQPPVDRHLDKLVKSIQALLDTPDTLLSVPANPKQDKLDIALFNEQAPYQWDRSPRANAMTRFINRLFDDTL
jgi:hypothetical protein